MHESNDQRDFLIFVKMFSNHKGLGKLVTNIQTARLGPGLQWDGTPCLFWVWERVLKLFSCFRL